MEKSIHNEIMELEPSTVVILYELVLKGHAASYYFHSGENGYTNEIVFQGNNYYYIPIKTDGFDFTDSKLPRPTLTVDNTDSFFSLKTRFFKDFIGFTFKRTRTFVKFLADVNFPSNVNPFGTPTEVSFPETRPLKVAFPDLISLSPYKITAGDPSLFAYCICFFKFPSPG